MEIKYHYHKEEDYDKEMKSDEYACLRYYSKRKLKEKYPKKTYTLVGAIGPGLKTKKGEFISGKEDKDYYTLEYSKVKYGIDGYLSLGNDCYVAVIKNIFIKNFISALIVLLVIGSLVVFGYKALLSSGMDPLARDYTPPESLNVKTDPNQIALPGYAQIRMRAGTDTAYVALWNPPENPCIFKYTIIMDDNGKVLYESGKIPPGKAITEVKFNQNIEEGVYPVTIKIDAFSIKDKNASLNGGEIVSQVVALK